MDKQNLQDFRDHVDRRFDRLEEKVDDHLSRLSRAEEAISWLRGHARVMTTVFLAVAGAVALAYLKYLEG